MIAVEIDRDLAGLVRDRFGDRVTLVEGDCLAKGRRLAPEVVSALEGSAFKLVANLPYQAASPLMASLLMHHPRVHWTVGHDPKSGGSFGGRPWNQSLGPLTAIVRAFAQHAASHSCRRVVSGRLPKSPVRWQSCCHVLRTSRPSDPDGFARFVTKLLSQRRKQIGGILGHEIAASLGIRASNSCRDFECRATAGVACPLACRSSFDAAVKR